MREGEGAAGLWPSGAARRWRALARLALADLARSAASLAIAVAILGTLLAPLPREVAAPRLTLPLSLAPAAVEAPLWGLRGWGLRAGSLRGWSLRGWGLG